MNDIYSEVQAIVTKRREAMQDLLYAVQGVLDLVNTYKKCDGTEFEFNQLRVVYENAKKVE